MRAGRSSKGQARRRNWREEDARRALEAQRRSGLSVEDFATWIGVSARRLQWWQQRLDGTASKPEVGRRSVELTRTVQPEETISADRGVRLIPAVAVGAAGGRVGEPAAVVLRVDDLVVEVAEAGAVPAPWVASLVAGVRRAAR